MENSGKGLKDKAEEISEDKNTRTVATITVCVCVSHNLWASTYNLQQLGTQTQFTHV